MIFSFIFIMKEIFSNNDCIILCLDGLNDNNVLNIKQIKCIHFYIIIYI